MLDRPETFRIAAIVVLIAVLVTALVAIHPPLSTPVAEDSPATSLPASDDLSIELHHCDAVGPTSADEAHCEAVWEENRRRFFGRPAQTLPSPEHQSSAAPAPNSAALSSRGDAR